MYIVVRVVQKRSDGRKHVGKSPPRSMKTWATRVEKRWGADQPEHYFPNAQTGKVQGSSWSDAGLLMLESHWPTCVMASQHLYDEPETGEEAVTEEVTKAIRLIRNWINDKHQPAAKQEGP